MKQSSQISNNKPLGCQCVKLQLEPLEISRLANDLLRARLYDSSFLLAMDSSYKNTARANTLIAFMQTVGGGLCRRGRYLSLKETPYVPSLSGAWLRRDIGGEH